MQSCLSPIAPASAAACRLRPPTMSNPAPDSSLPDCARFSCCLPQCHLRPLQLLLPARSRHPLPLALLPVCLRFQLLLPDCARFSCCSPLASTSAAAPDRVLFGCYILPDCVRFNCCSPIASASTAARPIASASTAARPISSASTAGPEHSSPRV